MAPVLKTGRAQALVGSNPTPSASSVSILDFELKARPRAVALRYGRICGGKKSRCDKRGERSDNRADDDIGQIMCGDILSRKRDQRRKSCGPRSATSTTTGISQSAVMFKCDGGCLF
jgi:hypothetical protein